MKWTSYLIHSWHSFTHDVHFRIYIVISRVISHIIHSWHTVKWWPNTWKSYATYNWAIHRCDLMSYVNESFSLYVTWFFHTRNDLFTRGIRIWIYIRTCSNDTHYNTCMCCTWHTAFNGQSCVWETSTVSRVCATSLIHATWLIGIFREIHLWLSKTARSYLAQTRIIFQGQKS